MPVEVLRVVRMVFRSLAGARTFYSGLEMHFFRLRRYDQNLCNNYVDLNGWLTPIPIANNCQGASYTLRNPWKPIYGRPGGPLVIVGNSIWLWVLWFDQKVDTRLLNCQQLPRSFQYPQKPLETHLRMPRRPLGNCWQFNLTLSALIWSKRLNERLEGICDFWIANNCQGASYTLRNPWKPIYGHPGSPLAIVGNSKYHWV